MEKIKSNRVTSKSERLGYYSYFVGQNILYIFVTLYLTLYFTTELGLPPMVVGTIFLIARVWDAINDPMLSILIEKSQLKGGKFKPWIKSVMILIPLLTVLNFTFSSFLVSTPLGVRIVYALIMYILWGMAYTISDAPAYALATVMTDDANEKNGLISFAKFFGMLGLVLSMIVGPMLVDLTNNNWFIVSLLLSIVAFLFLLGINLPKERIKSFEKTPTLKEITSAIFKNRYLVTIVTVIVLINGFNFAMTITPFLTEYVFGDASLTAVLMGISILPMLIAAPIVPMLVRKFGKNKLFSLSMTTMVVLSVLTYFVARNNFVLFVILLVIKFLLSSPMLIISALYFVDAIEYEYLTKGKRFEAVTFSIQTFSNKATAAIAGSVPMFLLGLFGFKESVGDQIIVQTPKVIDGIWMVYNLGPAFGALIGLIIFVKFYDLNETKLIEMKEESRYA